MEKIKTNVIRLLDKHKINYTCHTYEVEEGKVDGLAVTQKLGFEPSRVFKTLVMQGVSKNYYVCVIPVDEEVDLKKVSKLTGEKKIEMLHVKDLLQTTGYIRGGCSPIGMKKLFKTIIHQSAKEKEQMTVSAGKIGVQVSLAPDTLCELVKAVYADIV